jgi:hypothetical protein
MAPANPPASTSACSSGCTADERSMAVSRGGGQQRMHEQLLGKCREISANADHIYDIVKKKPGVDTLAINGSSGVIL